LADCAVWPDAAECTVPAIDERIDLGLVGQVVAGCVGQQVTGGEDRRSDDLAYEFGRVGLVGPLVSEELAQALVWCVVAKEPVRPQEASVASTCSLSVAAREPGAESDRIDSTSVANQHSPTTSSRSAAS